MKSATGVCQFATEVFLPDSGEEASSLQVPAHLEPASPATINSPGTGDLISPTILFRYNNPDRALRASCPQCTPSFAAGAGSRKCEICEGCDRTRNRHDNSSRRPI